MPKPTAPPETVTLQLADLPKPLDFAAVFGRQAPVEVEIGIGSGVFLARYAEDQPGLNLFGLDKAGSEVRRTADKLVRRGIENVRVLRCDAIYVLDLYVADKCVQKFHVYHSDPWPKKRHHKRRLWRPEFIRQMHRCLEDGGELLLKTDVTEYYEIIDALIAESGLFEKMGDRRLDREPMEGDYVTNFQRKALEAGSPVHWQRWAKR